MGDGPFPPPPPPPAPPLPDDVPPPMPSDEMPPPVSPGGRAFDQIIPVRNPPALWGYYLGVFSLVPCLGLVLGPAAVVCGVIGRGRVARTPGLPGTAHAWAGIVLGSLATLANVGGVVWSLTQ